MPKDYYGRGDYSDDESGSRGRDKFRRERERSPEKDDFGRDKRRRKPSDSPEDRERRPKRNRSTSKDGDGEPGDRYIPNYERDGYNPAPRYSRLIISAADSMALAVMATTAALDVGMMGMAIWMDQSLYITATCPRAGERWIVSTTQ